MSKMETKKQDSLVSLREEKLEFSNLTLGKCSTVVQGKPLPKKFIISDQKNREHVQTIEEFSDQKNTGHVQTIEDFPTHSRVPQRKFTSMLGCIFHVNTFLLPLLLLTMFKLVPERIDEMKTSCDDDIDPTVLYLSVFCGVFAYTVCLVTLLVLWFMLYVSPFVISPFLAFDAWHRFTEVATRAKTSLIRAVLITAFFWTEICCTVALDKDLTSDYASYGHQAAFLPWILLLAVLIYLRVISCMGSLCWLSACIYGTLAGTIPTFLMTYAHPVFILWPVRYGSLILFFLALLLIISGYIRLHGEGETNDVRLQMCWVLYLELMAVIMTVNYDLFAHGSLYTEEEILQFMHGSFSSVSRVIACFLLVLCQLSQSRLQVVSFSLQAEPKSRSIKLCNLSIDNRCKISH